MADHSEIKLFLHSVKYADFIDFVPTEKNRQTRFLIGMTTYDQEDMVRNLSIDDYYSGPEKDRDPSRLGMLWMFKHTYRGHELYIKLKEVQIVEGNSIVKCLSCHIDYI